MKEKKLEIRNYWKNSKQQGGMGWTHGQIERMTKRYKETRRLQKSKTISAKMRVLSEY